jgi:DNA-binding MarR family transcriptional regulator
MRTDEDRSRFYYTKKWGYNPENNKDWSILPAFDPSDATQQSGVFYYKEYSTQSSEYPVYPQPEYIASIPLIEAAYEIANFHLSNIKQGFWGAFAIMFNNGVPSPEEQKKIEAGLRKKFTGTDNAGKFVTLFSAGGDKNGVDLKSLTPNELDKMFTVLNVMIKEEIFTGHKVTSPMLFGVKTEGQLGGRTEMIVAYEIFKNSYISNKQSVIEDSFNYLLTGNRYERVIKLEEKPRIQDALSRDKIAEKMTDDEIRKEGGLPPLEKTTPDETDGVLQKLNTMSPLLATQVLQSMSQDQILALVGVKPDGAAPTPHSPSQTTTPVTLKKQFTEADDDILLSHFSECGRPASEYTIHKTRYLWFSKPSQWREQLLIGENHLIKQCFAPVSGKVIDQELAILKILDKSPDATAAAIAKQLKISVEKVKSIILDMVDAGLLEKSGKVITITPAGEKVIPPIDKEIIEIELMYQYALNPAYSGPAIIPTSRKFCREMIEAGKLYTSEEIQKIASKVEYDVWLYKGGWYHNPNTGETTPSCRHLWASVVVTKKRSA